MTTKPLVDHRIYNITPRCMPQYLEVFQRMAMPLLIETLGHPIGFYTTVVGPLNQFVHLWAYDDMADYEARCKARDMHPDFLPYLEASKPYILSQETRLIKSIAGLNMHLSA
jgi:NIPSNAP